MNFPNNSFVIRFFSSLKLTVICLLLLIILIFCGTLYQIEHGLYLAQQKYFDSFFLFIGPLPFPGAKLVMWILFFNLIAGFAFKYQKDLKKPRILITHLGLLILLISGFVNQEFSKESFVSLTEGEASDISQDYQEWKLLVLDEKGNLLKDFHNKDLQKGKSLEIADLKINIDKRYINAMLFDTPFAGRIFKELPVEKEYEKNSPALALAVGKEKFILDAGVQSSYELELNAKKYIFVFQREEYQLPFAITLNDVVRDLHPGTQIAKSYKSEITVNENNLERKLTISMNKPFRSHGYTVYQSNYGIDENGNEFSVLAVVKNPNFVLAYFASLFTSLGLFMIFIRKVFKYKRNFVNAE